MSLHCCTVFILLFVPLLARAQSPKQQIQTEVELGCALFDGQRDQRAKELLLKAHPELMNSRLWSALIDQAASAYYTQSRQRTLAIYEAAIEIARELHNPTLLAKTYYNLGRTYSGLNEPSNAMQCYEKSREYFQQAG